MKALYLLLFVSSSALANDAALLKCRALGDVATRVACYDAIPVGAAPAVAATAAAVPAPAAARPAVAATAEQRFGIETIRRPSEQPKAIESTVVGEFDGWKVGSQLQLANGQVWRVISGGEAVLPRTTNQKVRIVRSAVGSLFLEVEGSSVWAKVRRVQ